MSRVREASASATRSQSEKQLTMDVMNPTLPAKPGTLYPLLVSFGSSSTLLNSGYFARMTSSISWYENSLPCDHLLPAYGKRSRVSHLRHKDDRDARHALLTAEGHKLDEADLDVHVPRELDKVDNLVLVEVSHHHHVQLGRQPIRTQ